MTKYIAREEVKRIICEICGECDGDVDVCEFRDIKVDTITAVDAITAADVVPGRDYRDCRNELCLKCGDYKQRHLGACDGCRWRDA